MSSLAWERFGHSRRIVVFHLSFRRLLMRAAIDGALLSSMCRGAQHFLRRRAD